MCYPPIPFFPNSIPTENGSNWGKN